MREGGIMGTLRSCKVQMTNLCCLLKCDGENTKVLSHPDPQQEAAAEPHNGRSHGL